MARIAGVDLPRRKHIVYALPYIYGVGHTKARELCEKAVRTKKQAASIKDLVDRLREKAEIDTFLK